jgi:hypothetical protein
MKNTCAIFYFLAMSKDHYIENIKRVDYAIRILGINHVTLIVID